MNKLFIKAVGKKSFWSAGRGWHFQQQVLLLRIPTLTAVMKTAAEVWELGTTGNNWVSVCEKKHFVSEFYVPSSFPISPWIWVMSQMELCHESLAGLHWPTFTALNRKCEKCLKIQAHLMCYKASDIIKERKKENCQELRGKPCTFN